MNKTSVGNDLVRHSRDTGIPLNELKAMCLRAGLEKLQNEGITVAAEEKLPIFLPAADVRFLREICEAADITDGAEGFVGSIIGDMVQDSLQNKAGVSELIETGWILRDSATVVAAMHAVIDRWNASSGGSA